MAVMKKLIIPILLVMTAALAACGGGGGGDSGATTTEVPVASAPEPVSADAAAKWPAAWCASEPGISRDDLAVAMGEPTSESTMDLAWVGFGYAFYAFVNTDGNVYQMDVNGTPVDCETSRKLS